MRAAVMVGPDAPLVVEELRTGDLGAHDVEVDIDAAGVCRSDLTLLAGLMPAPAVLGHEGTGIVARVGADVRSVRAGDRVVGTFTPVCGRCWYCHNDLPQHCERALRIAMEPRTQRRDGQPVVGASGLGTWASAMRTHETSLVRVRSDLPPEELALIGCAVTTGVGAAINTAQVTPGSSVAVIGCGGVGQFVVQGARIAGGSVIVAVDPDGSKRRAASAVGATHAIDPGRGDLAAELRSLTGGRGVDFAFEVVGRPDVVRQAFDVTRRGGTTVIVGMPPLDAEARLPLFDWFHQEKRVLGCNYGSASVRRDFDRLIGLAENGRLDIGASVTDSFDLDHVNDAVDAMRAGSVVRAVLLPQT